MNIKFFLRLFRISLVFAKYRIDALIVSIPFFKGLRFFTYFNPLNWSKSKESSRGQALCLALEELGPIFIKFGQALSTRKDLLPKDIIEHLSRLQDNVQPFASELASEILEKAYEQPIDEVFSRFEREPFASASIAQVHKATLTCGQEAIIKIVRPNIIKAIKTDIHVMYTIANMLKRHWQASDRVKPREIVEEFESTLLDELDMMREAANASLLRRHYLNSDELYVPEVYWDYCRPNVLVTERIHGIPISNIDTLKQKGINLKKLAETGINIFFTQVFENGFFHADMHPGNIFAHPEKQDPPQYLAVDFGIMGSLTDTDKRYLAQNLLAFFNRDYRQIALLHIESGWVPTDTRVDVFESAIRTVAEPIFGRPLKDMSFAKVVINLFKTARHFHMEVQPQLILLQKTLLAVEGLGRELYPEINLWDTAKPFLEKWVRQELGPMNVAKTVSSHLPYMMNQLPHIPKLVVEALESQTKISKALTNFDQVQKQKRRPYLLSTGVMLALFPLASLGLRYLPNDINFEILGLSTTAVGALIALYALRLNPK